MLSRDVEAWFRHEPEDPLIGSSGIQPTSSWFTGALQLNPLFLRARLSAFPPPGYRVDPHSTCAATSRWKDIPAPLTCRTCMVCIHRKNLILNTAGDRSRWASS